MENKKWKTEDPPKDRTIHVQYQQHSSAKNNYVLEWGIPMNVYWNNDKKYWMSKDIPFWRGTDKKPDRWKEIE